MFTSSQSISITEYATDFPARAVARADCNPSKLLPPPGLAAMTCRPPRRHPLVNSSKSGHADGSDGATPERSSCKVCLRVADKGFN